MTNDVIYRHLAIAYASSGRIKRIDGEDWIRISEVKQSLRDVPIATVPLTVTINDKITDEDIETIKQLVNNYKLETSNVEFKQLVQGSDGCYYQKTCATCKYNGGNNHIPHIACCISCYDYSQWEANDNG